jgi:hypothetical protein
VRNLRLNKINARTPNGENAKTIWEDDMKLMKKMTFVGLLLASTSAAAQTV